MESNINGNAMFHGKDEVVQQQEITNLVTAQNVSDMNLTDGNERVSVPFYDTSVFQLLNNTVAASAISLSSMEGRDVSVIETVELVSVPVALFMAWCFGTAINRFARLPQVIGFCISGFMFGPYSPLGAVLINKDNIEGLHNIMDSICLGVIAVSAGSELVLSECKKSFRAISSIVLSITCWSISLTFISSLLAISAFEPGGARALSTQHFIIASLVAVIAAARSPASAIAVLNEIDGKGIFCSLTMSVIIAKDVLVFVLFALIVGTFSVNPIMVVKVDQVVGELADDVRASTAVRGNLLKIIDILFVIVLPLVQVFLSCGIGYVSSKFFVKILRMKLTSLQDKVLRPLAVVVMAATVFTTTDHMNAEPMLANVVVGLMITNQQYLQGGSIVMSSSTAKADCREVFDRSLKRIMPYVNLIFFTMIGATVKMENISESILISLCIFLSRIIGIISGCRFGYWMGQAPHEHSKFAWMAYITQAGVALGLVKTITLKFPTVGKTVASYLITVILINMLIGPVMFKLAISKAGEMKRLKSDIEKEIHV